jgi:hypothetical protein
VCGKEFMGEESKDVGNEKLTKVSRSGSLAAEEKLVSLRREYEWNRIDPELPCQIANLYVELGRDREAIDFFQIVYRDYRTYTPHFIPHIECLARLSEETRANELISEGLVLADAINDEELKLRLVALKVRVERNQR